ncbi:MAG: hypothetical protein AABX98_03715, partial [Nanoarchaeota archaeon]
RHKLKNSVCNICRQKEEKEKRLNNIKQYGEGRYYVTCFLCMELFVFITAKHLKNIHNTTKKDYLLKIMMKNILKNPSQNPFLFITVKSRHPSATITHVLKELL